MTNSEKGQECVYIVYYTFCIIMMHCQDDKIECGLAEIIKSAHIKRKKSCYFSFECYIKVILTWYVGERIFTPG